MRVCRRCNQRLNKVFEIPAKPVLTPMFEGREVELTARQQVLVAGWVAKSGLVFAVAGRRSRERAGPTRIEQWRKLLIDVMETGLPPANSSVRIGGMVPWDEDRIERADTHPFGVHPQLATANLVVAVAWFGHVIWEHVVGVDVDVLPFIDATPDDDRLIRVWPPQIPNRRWPPPTWFTPQTAGSLREEWRLKPEASHQAKPYWIRP